MKYKQELFSDFNIRVVEVSQYFMFLKSLEKASLAKGVNIEKFQLYLGVDETRMSLVYFNSEVEKTLKATGFLLLYNLTEFTIRNAITTIFDELRTKKISFDELKSEIQEIIIENLKKKKSNKIVQKISHVAYDIIEIAFDNLDQEQLFSGNLDAKKIRTIADDYGFSSDTNSSKTQDGIDLKIVKERRNFLGHGYQSFNEIGKEETAESLFKIKNRVILYLKEILENINSYLENESYLK